ncbi:hypothetical protein AMTRI_Chr01g128690 [Amborella trichopoda]
MRLSSEFSSDFLPNSGVCESSEPYKKTKFECRSCKNIFKSYQALGALIENGELLGCLNSREIEEGKIKNSATTMENGNQKDRGLSEAILGTLINQKLQGNRRKFDSFSVTTMENGGISGFPNKTKFHQCPYFYMVFGYDQALGGHRQSHGASTKLGLKPPSEAESALDLNKPAPGNKVEGDQISRIQIMG